MEMNALQQDAATGRAPGKASMVPPNKADAASPDRVQIHKLAREAFEAAGGDYDAATDALVSDIQSQPDLLRQAFDEIVRPWVKNAVYLSASKARSQIINQMEAQPIDGGKAKVMALATSNLMNYPLSSGVILAEAKAEDIRPAADRQVTMARETLHRGQWLIAIAERLPAGKRVKDVLTEPDLKAIWEETHVA